MGNLKDFKFLVIGLGSMGKRRIRNLLYHGVKSENIFGFNPTAQRCRRVTKLFKIKTTTSFVKAIKDFKPNVFIISSPPNQHAKYILYALKNKIHFFVEHPTEVSGYQEVINDNTKLVKAPSCSLRYFPAIKQMKKIIDSNKIGKVLSFQYHLGQYLPDWHPWEDYRKVYFSKKATGACREMFAFELGWLGYLLGLKAKQIFGFNKKLSNLNMSADDYYSALVKFNNNIIGSMVIDVLSRAPFRTLRINGSQGVLEWEWQDYKIKIYSAQTKKWKIIKIEKGRSEKNYISTEDMYEEEIKYFLDAIVGKHKYPFSFKDNYHYLKALLALEESDRTGKVISL